MFGCEATTIHFSDLEEKLNKRKKLLKYQKDFRTNKYVEVENELGMLKDMAQHYDEDLIVFHYNSAVPIAAGPLDYYDGEREFYALVELGKINIFINH